MAERIVVGFDNSPAALAALEWAKCQAQLVGAELVLVYVSSAARAWELAAAQINTDPMRAEAKRRLAGEWTAPLREAGVPYRARVTEGRVADELMKVARAEDASLIVVGMTARGTLTELVFGSTRHDLLHHAVRPVVAVPAPAA
ncbi:MAG TPA: universal stress protein [Acidimicrobiia bacterium]|jgi:nucleotide-binding universal stress UspA family protein|nr:universal stress protein [Acidimicrobiia bacterium]